MGSVAESGLFEVLAPRQVQYHVEGSVSCESGVLLRALLRDYTRDQELSVCGARVGSGTKERFVLRGAASLLLDPGIYGWQSRLIAPAGISLEAPRLSGFWAQNPEPLETRGTTEAYSIIGGAGGENWNARGYVTVLAPGEPVYARLVVTDLSSNKPVGPPSELALGSPMQDKDVGFVPYVLEGGKRYEARLTVECRAAVNCRLLQSKL